MNSFEKEILQSMKKMKLKNIDKNILKIITSKKKKLEDIDKINKIFKKLKKYTDKVGQKYKPTEKNIKKIRKSYQKKVDKFTEKIKKYLKPYKKEIINNIGDIMIYINVKKYHTTMIKLLATQCLMDLNIKSKDLNEILPSNIF